MRSSTQIFLSVEKKIMLVLVSGTIRHGTKKRDTDRVNKRRRA